MTVPDENLALCGDERDGRTCVLRARHSGQHMAFNATRPLITSWYPPQPWERRGADACTNPSA